jgi:class 3 adenylate cyclase
VGQLEFRPPLQVRIGIHTGPVVVGEIGAGERTERLALGETPNLAARVQGHAAPNEVLVSTVTFRLIHGLFDIEDRGPQELKGISAIPGERQNPVTTALSQLPFRKHQCENPPLTGTI